MSANLVQHLKQIHVDADTRAFGVLDFASAFGSPLDALMYCKLFWPDFVEFEEMVFLSSILESEDNRSHVRAALTKGTSRIEIEQSFNSFEIPSDFFASHRIPTTDVENSELAEQMAQMWRARLTQLFPKLSFDVQVSHSPDEAPTLTVSQCRCFVS